MPPVRAPLALAALLLFSGCGYIHFGRLPEGAPADAGIAEAYANLSTEHKILKQELVLARREGDALRATVDRAGGASPELVNRLNETTRELATLRASYARLQAERGGSATGAPDADARAQFSALEEKLAASLRDFTRLQEENSRLRADLDRAREQNTTLASQLNTAVAGRIEAQTALTQLNNELIAQKEARARADQAAAAVRGQLGAVLAAGPGAGGTTGTPPPEAAAPAANPASALRLARTPPADASGIAELRTSPDRLRALEPAPPATAAPAAAASRTHVVEAGDTLEKIAQRYYGQPGQWHRIYEANAAVLGNGQPLAIGMRLNVPEN